MGQTSCMLLEFNNEYQCVAYAQWNKGDIFRQLQMTRTGDTRGYPYRGFPFLNQSKSNQLNFTQHKTNQINQMLVFEERENRSRVEN